MLLLGSPATLLRRWVGCVSSARRSGSVLVPCAAVVMLHECSDNGPMTFCSNKFSGSEVSSIYFGRSRYWSVLSEASFSLCQQGFLQRGEKNTPLTALPGPHWPLVFHHRQAVNTDVLRQEQRKAQRLRVNIFAARWDHTHRTRWRTHWSFTSIKHAFSVILELLDLKK